MNGTWREQMVLALPGERLRFNVPLRQVTTLRIGGAAECLAEPETETELETVFRFVAEYGLSIHVLGKGSNVLVPDAGLPGVVVRLGRGFEEISREGETVRAGAGAPNGGLVERCRRWGLSGLEFLIAVPGTVGGAIAMNAGAHRGETAQVLKAVRYLEVEGGLKTASAEEFEFSYRSSPLRAPLGKIVVSGDFGLSAAPVEEIEEKVAEYQTYRRETQPRDFPNCGSVFKNPPGDFAARLIEHAGLKGAQVGDAQVSLKHANFIVNRGDATAADVLALIDLIKGKVYTLSGKTLELELQIL